MEISSLRKSSLEPFDNLALIRRYFAAVKAMDQNALKGTPVEPKTIMALWDKGGQLAIHGPDPIGEKQFRGTKELSGFYSRRARGVDGELKVNLSRVNTAQSKSGEQVTVSGSRYVVAKSGEGMQVPFAHKFTIADGKITHLEISVGKAGPTEIAPIGALDVADLGRLSAMAWMVA
jgi:ketosteroid isomerase-like protein